MLLQRLAVEMAVVRFRSRGKSIELVFNLSTEERGSLSPRLFPRCKRALLVATSPWKILGIKANP